jgi:hypothetical protein
VDDPRERGREELFDLDVRDLPGDEPSELMARMRTSTSASFSCTYLC